jgi:hypothetical protein
MPSAAVAGDAEEDTSVTTSSSGDRIKADIFRVGGGGDREVFDLEGYCDEAFDAQDNGWEVERRERANTEAEAAGQPIPYPDLLADLPNPGITPNADADTDPCNGTSARLASNPPNPPCPYTEIKAETGYFSYDTDANTIIFTPSSEYTGVRQDGGDSGVFDTEYVCLDVIDDFETEASFDELVVAPGFWKSPELIGLTGLDTWVWYDFTDPESHTITRDFTVSADGLPLGVNATIWVDMIRWDMDGNGNWDVEVDFPDTELTAATPTQYHQFGGDNTEDGTAGTWLYQTKGTYPVTVEIEWRGIYEFVGYPANDGYYDPLTAATTNNYQVCELVAVLNQTNGPDIPDTCTT